LGAGQLKAALLFRLKPFDHAGFLPQLYGVTVNQLFCKPLGFRIVIANDLDTARDMAVTPDNVGVIPPHGARRLYWGP
jgi:hypothetical protein